MSSKVHTVGLLLRDFKYCFTKLSFECPTVGGVAINDTRKYHTTKDLKKEEVKLIQYFTRGQF